jgi:hypothetical protein
MASIFGLNPYKSVNQMLEAKQNNTFTGNAYTIIGNLLEPVVVGLVNEELNENFQLFEHEVDRKTFYINRDLMLGATPDACNGKTLLECKSTKPRNYYRWNSMPPMQYVAQLYTQMLCSEFDEGYLAIMETDLTQTSEELNTHMCIFHLTQSEEITKIIESEMKRFKKSLKDKKMFRVNRKLSEELKWKFRLNLTKVR